MSDGETLVSELKEIVQNFVQARLWEKYHNPKDLAESICIEAAELLELFQWRNFEEVQELIQKDKFKANIAEELADIIIYSLSLMNVLNINLVKTIVTKLEKNERKYPVDKYHGKAYID